MNDLRVHTWSELQEAVFSDSWRDSISRHRSQWVFRGVPRETHALETSLQTGGLVAHERHLLTSFRKYALRNAVHGDHVWNWLSLAKHHGLPTRLLDWTYSPYVAMHFATHDVKDFDVDGAIWCVDFRRTNAMLPKALRGMLEKEDANIFTTDLLNRVATSLADFGKLGKDEDFVVFFEPPSLDERIVNQFALFSLPSRPALRLEELLQRGEATTRRIIIPAALKWEVRDKLDQANITERVLFPGLDGLSQWLKRYFTTREPFKAAPRSVAAGGAPPTARGSSRGAGARRGR
jgi:hypothetical protein